MNKLTYGKMGRFLTGAFLAGAFAALPAHAQYSSLLEAQSPLDYWRLNETAPSPAVQIFTNLGSTGFSGNGYGIHAQTGQAGIVGSSLYLTNTGQNIGFCYSHVDIPNIAALNPEPPFSVEFWFKPATTATNNTFAPSDSTGACPLSSDSPFPGDGSRSGYLFYVLPGSVTFRIGGEQSYTATAVAPFTVPTNAFTHVVAEYDGTKVSLYVNGALAGTGAGSVSSPFLPNRWVATRIGGTSLLGGEFVDGFGGGAYYTGNRGWDGWIDEVAVYNTLLSSSTVMSHYTTATGNPAGYDSLVMASSPVGYWNFDQPAYTAPAPNTYTFAADSGSLVDNATNTLGTQADQPGVPGLSADARSVYYNGVAGSMVLDTNAVQPDFSGQPITLAAWVKPGAYNYVGNIIAQGFDNIYAENFLRVGDAYDWEYLSDDFSYGNYNTNVVPDVPFYEVGAFNGGEINLIGYVTAAFPAPPGDIGHWVFLVGTYDGSAWNLYRNGTLVNSIADGGIGPATVAAPWSVGSAANPNAYLGLTFTGYIEEPSILTTALDPTTISNLYNSVALPPVITQAPVAPSPAYLGSSASFSVWADGPGTLSYQWYSNNVAVSGQTGTNFTINGLTAAANTTYSVVVANSHGSVTSSVALVVTPTLPPATLVPVTESRWTNFPFSFAPASLPNQQLAFQWYQNGAPIAGATQSGYTNNTLTTSAGSYTLVLSNNFGMATSTVATLSYLTPPNLYVSTVLADQPLAYYRMDEANGTVAFDYAGGNNGNYYDVQLGVPGYYPPVDSDLAVGFLGVTNSYLGDIGTSTINFAGANSEFAVEAWANGPAVQVANATVIAKGTGNNGGVDNEQFAMDVSGGLYRFYVTDPKGNVTAVIATSGPDGQWHHLVGVCDYANSQLTLYIDGLQAAQTAPPGNGGITSASAENAVSIGSERSGPTPDYDWSYAGTIDEVAIYSHALSAAQVLSHYAASFGPHTAPYITVQPVSVTNYVSLPVTLSVTAAGSYPLTYQWNQKGVGAYPGATAKTFTIPSLAFSDAGTYTVGITNPVGGTSSVPVIVTVLPAPTVAPPIAGLVLHLTFDDNLNDTSGRGNNATNEASGGIPVVTSDYEGGVIGDAFTYQTTVTGSTTNANYASVGYRPDLQFGSNTDFTVSMWVQEPFGYIGNDLPFFTDAIGSTYGKGYVFAPSYGTTVGTTAGYFGAWAYSVFDNPQANAGNGAGIYGVPESTINDGNFHSLVFVISRKGGGTVYLDGVLAGSKVDGGTSIQAAGNIDVTNYATIGQDPTGLYSGAPGSIAGTFAIDDLGVWRRALTSLEAASIYMAGSVNQVSFTGVPLTFTAQKISSSNLVLNWNEGALQSATSLSGPWTTVQGATSPYTNAPTGASTFFRVKF
ncbi:MAG TPA: LamG-like jellyroll fold domain-containing protein [Verrucomicrobiae bacterium]